jgi:hypothetical protein
MIFTVAIQTRAHNQLKLGGFDLGSLYLYPIEHHRILIEYLIVFDVQNFVCHMCS